MNVRVQLFARARELARAEVIEIDLPAGDNVAELRRRLAERCPALAGLLERSAIAVNEEFAVDATVVPEGAAIAVLPPVSGGS